jgi:hypothetical protein
LSIQKHKYSQPAKVVMALPQFSFTLDYFLYILAVTINSLLMIIIGGWMKERMQKGGLRFGFANRSRFRRKIFGFLLFILAIFILGFLSERLQVALLNYLKTNVATNILGLCIAVLVAYMLYDWLVFRKNRDD